MSAGILEIRAKEISALRRQNRSLRAELSALRDRAGENDATLMTLHNLALLLAENGGYGRNPREWVAEAEALLARRLCGRGGRCRVRYFGWERGGRSGKGGGGDRGGKGEGGGGGIADLQRAAKKMRLEGHAGDAPPRGAEAMADASLRAFCAAPLRRGRETVGLVLLASRRTEAFPPDASRDFLRRLAQLLAAAAP